MPVKIISDSMCDLSEELLHRYRIAIAPLTVVLGDWSGLDGEEITPDDIYRYVEETNSLPTSSAVNSDAYISLFRQWRAQGYEIIHFCISSELSGSYQNACIAAREVGGVYPMDSRSLSGGQGLMVLKAAEMALAGASAEDILNACEGMIPHVEITFVANSIEYLYKGGRCSALAALGANLLHIKPCIEVKDGRLVLGKKYRGSINKVINAFAIDRLKNRTDIDHERVFITHTRCKPETIEGVRRLIQQYQPGFREILETTAGATIITHCGPDTIGISFVTKRE